MQPSKLVSKQKPVTAAAAARAGWWLRALRLFNGKRRGQTPEKRGRERERATRPLASCAMVRRERRRRSSGERGRERGAVAEKNVADGSGERQVKPRPPASPPEKKKEGCEKRRDQG